MLPEIEPRGRKLSVLAPRICWLLREKSVKMERISFKKGLELGPDIEQAFHSVEVESSSCYICMNYIRSMHTVACVFTVK